jgi:hypothetical protein
MDENKMYQNIVIKLSDSRLIAATVPVFFRVGDPAISVREVRISPPQKLPEDCYWKKINDIVGKML